MSEPDCIKSAKLKNLVIGDELNGLLFVNGQSKLLGDLSVTGLTNISNTLTVGNKVNLNSSLSVASTTFLSNVNIRGNLSVLGSVNVSNTINIGNKIFLGNGLISAENKSFLIPHPVLKNKKLRHGCLEGPEHGIYIRGTLESETDEINIKIPEYFTALCNDKFTVNLTSYGNYNVYLKEKSKTNLIIKSNKINFKIDFLIIGCRDKITIVE